MNRVNPDSVADRFKSYEGRPLDLKAIDSDVMPTFGQSEFDAVDYTLLTIRDKNILRISPIEKGLGPDYIRSGMNLDSNLGRDATYNARIAYHKTWLNSLGGEWISGVQIGNNPKVFTEFYQPLDRARLFFFEPKFAYQREPVRIYQDNHNLANYKVDEVRLDAMAGVNVGVLGSIRLGWVERRRNAELETGSPSMPNGTKQFGGWAASLDFDQFDRLYFATRGWAVKAKYFDSPDEKYSKAELELRMAHPVNDYIFHTRFYCAVSPKGTLPIFDPATLGGFLNMSGFVKNQISGDSVAYGNVRAEKIIGELPLGLRGDMRLGVALEAGKVGGRFTETNLDG